MSIFVEYSSAPPRRVFVTEVLFRVAMFYCAATLVFGLTSWFEAPWMAGYDEQLPLMLAQDGAIFLLLSCWFGTLATFFSQRFYGATVPAFASRWFLFLQFLLFGLAMWPLA
ncbi:MAG: hypothetical protein U0931_31955 [Vulcanimicrobiota bacterium]